MVILIRFLGQALTKTKQTIYIRIQLDDIYKI